MADDDRKGKADEQDEEKDDGSTPGGEGVPVSEDDQEAAKRVAAALGVESDEDKAEEGGEEEAAPQNRAARRAEAAQRRKKRKDAADADDKPVEPELPKDKNARAKELLKRRREQAAEARQPVQLLPSEMVDDALARTSAAAGKWIRKNFGILQWFIVGGVVIGGGYLFYISQAEKRAAAATGALIAGVNADRGRVAEEDKRTDEEKEFDTLKVYKTIAERADSALEGYRKVGAEHAGTGAAVLAKLGEGSGYLDKRDWDKALEAYSSVVSSTLAGADPEVKARALEGLGFAKEGKKDLDGALATFKELQQVPGNKELGQYHQGRVLLAKGDKDKAKDLLKEVHDALEKSGEARTHRYLQQVTDEALRRIDPALVPPKPVIGGGAKGGAMSKEELEAALKRLQENMAKKEKHE